MDPIIIPITFCGILMIAGLVAHVLALREERQHRTDSK